MRLDELTPRQREFVKLTAGGFRTDSIAQEMKITPSTVSTVRANVFKKIKVSCQIEMLHYFYDFVERN